METPSTEELIQITGTKVTERELFTEGNEPVTGRKLFEKPIEPIAEAANEKRKA